MKKKKTFFFKLIRGSKYFYRNSLPVATATILLCSNDALITKVFSLMTGVTVSVISFLVFISCSNIARSRAAIDAISCVLNFGFIS